MRHQATAPLVETETWINNLTHKVYMDLPTDLRVAHIRMQRTIAGCDLDDTSLVCLDKPPSTYFAYACPGTSLLYYQDA